MGFGIAKFRIAKFSHCEFGIAKFSHCEIGIGIAKFRIAKFSHCECGIAKIFALRNWLLALRSAQCPAATVPLLLHPAASHPASTASHFLHFSFDFPLIFGLVDG